MVTRVGINGFGRMGRLAFRAAWDLTEIAITHINEIKGGPATAAHLLKFDSVHGRWSKPTQTGESQLTVDGRKIAFTAEPAPNHVPWEANGVDIVLECSGKFLTPRHAEFVFSCDGAPATRNSTHEPHRDIELASKKIADRNRRRLCKGADRRIDSLNKNRFNQRRRLCRVV